jgi:adenylate cyclase
MNKSKLLILEVIISLLIGFLTFYTYVGQSPFFENLNNKITDAFFLLRGEIKPSDNVVIVDIDEKSLKELGQWPWSRNKVATILENLSGANVGIVGLDIVFAESDNSSPKRVLKNLGIKDIEAPDFDVVLAKTLANTPTISGYMFNFQEKTNGIKAPNIATIVVEKNYEDKEYLPYASGVTPNIEILQENSYSSGFFNTIPDTDGIVRSVPLLVKYEGSIYPSLSLEILRLIYGVDKITVEYGQSGITSINLADQVIPTDRFGRLNLNYYGKSKLFKYISAVDIYNGNFKKEDINGKVVLVGTSAGGLLDLRATPFESVYAGVEVHATAIENILTKSYIKIPDWIEGANVLMIWTMIVLVTFISLFFGASLGALFFTLLVSGFVYFSFYMFAYEGVVFSVIYPFISSISLYLVLTTLHYIFEAKQKELIKGKFAKKVSNAVAEELIKHGDKDVFEAKEEEITIFFSDIRGFTSISEKLNNPKKLIEFLNLYMTPMTQIITDSKGTVDKFIGDAIMAYWNAPLKVENHADVAVQCAIDQINELKKVNEKLAKLGFPSIDIGIGINTGLAVVGEMGSKGRSDYTIIGDSVNLGSRTEGLCKTYKAQILITEFTKEKLKKRYNIEFVEEVKVKGKEKAVKIYRIIPNDKDTRLTRQ